MLRILVGSERSIRDGMTTNPFPTRSTRPTPESAAVPFGRARRADFLLADGIAHLNHGAFGATPRVVLAASDQWRARMEADPSTFFRRDLLPLLRESAVRVASFLGGDGPDWAFVENATAGMNAIIRSLVLAPGDELLCLSQVYGAVGNALQYHADRAGARVVRVPIGMPFDDPGPLLAALKTAVTPRTRLAVFDHVTSPGAIVLPVQQMAAVCRDAGVPVAIDGAHATYEELPSDPITRLRHIVLHAVPDTPHTRFGTSVWYAYLAKSVDDPEIGRLLAETKRGKEDELPLIPI